MASATLIAPPTPPSPSANHDPRTTYGCPERGHVLRVSGCCVSRVAVHADLASAAALAAADENRPTRTVQVGLGQGQGFADPQPARHRITISERRRAPSASSPAARITATISSIVGGSAARRHGVAEQDILHAIDHALATEDAGEDPDRWLIIGPDTAGNLLEVVAMITAEGNQVAIHAMPMRDST